MTKKTHPAAWAALGAELTSAIQCSVEHILLNATAQKTMADSLKFRSRKPAPPSTFDLRSVIRIQRKNKHPHSTKKHK